MKITGFTIIRNAVKFDYPVIEAICSILPICDEFIVALGNSEDETETLIQNINSDKIKIIHTVWDETVRAGGSVLAIETNKAMDAISADTDWCFYIQADEVLHEKYIPGIKAAMLDHVDDKNVEGLLFNYTHFYGSYEYVADSPNWYRKEIRVIRKDSAIRSYKDAQGFRKDGKKLKVKQMDAHIFHYGWVKNPYFQIEKAKSFNRYWHDDQWLDEQMPKIELFDYSEIESLTVFSETHPQVMLKRIHKQNWNFTFDTNRKRLSVKNRIKVMLESLTGWRPGEYKNYKIIS